MLGPDSIFHRGQLVIFVFPRAAYFAISSFYDSLKMYLFFILEKEHEQKGEKDRESQADSVLSMEPV